MNVLNAITRLCQPADEQLMWRVKTDGDPEAFARLVQRWEQPIFRLCARMTGDVHRGEDLKQETFLRLFEKRKDYQPSARFSTYLWRIAINLCHDELRRQQRRRQFFEPSPIATSDGEEQPAAEPQAQTPGPDLHAAQLEEADLVRQALAQLPDIYRTVVVLRHYEGMKLTQIAEVLDIPSGTVNSRMAEALHRLNRILEPTLRADSPRPGTLFSTKAPSL